MKIAIIEPNIGMTLGGLREKQLFQFSFKDVNRSGNLYMKTKRRVEHINRNMCEYVCLETGEILAAGYALDVIPLGQLKIDMS